MRRPQKGWSATNGQMTCGRPAATAAAVVPAPPWCTTRLVGRCGWTAPDFRAWLAGQMAAALLGTPA
ncbi:hypothetical protein QP939_47435 [Amycolatopsis nalaikhensis]|uniref:Uncharacterized protein n=1 Tax=Amycolatopsis nalaikhensis TaxID=715472 RepID=A0ABY8XL43_9PSEU|nr:hypothetical protein [Amycolatopsis sp. 2-2]WIV56353.1 hypothetical protein QP939_47435 [Amycolatopsis sp. 2-2]